MIPAREINYNSPSLALLKYGLQQLKTLVIEDYKRSKTGLVGAANRYLPNRVLQNAIPYRRKDGTKDTRYRKYRTIAKSFDKVRLSGVGQIKNYLLLRILIRKVRVPGVRYRKVNSQDYACEKNKKEYNTKLKNSIKWFNKHWVPIGYKAKFHSDYCEVIKIP